MNAPAVAIVKTDHQITIRVKTEGARDSADVVRATADLVRKSLNVRDEAKGEEITLTNGMVDQGNYDTYTPLRIDQMPVIEVHILPSENPPTGAGEPGVPPIGPALANAVYQATKKRVRTLPFAKGLTA